MTQKTKVYVAAYDYSDGNYLGVALDEFGVAVASHMSSSIGWVKRDLGIEGTYVEGSFTPSGFYKKNYDKEYPEGYELIWIEDPEKDQRWIDAKKLNDETEGEGAREREVTK